MKKMEMNGEKLTHRHHMQQKGCERKRFNAALIYHALIDDVCEIVTDRGRELVIGDGYKYTLGQIALWYANDERFTGDLRKGIMLRGGVGTGKTVIATALTKTMLAAEKIHARFIHASDLQNLYVTQNEEEIQILKKRTYTIVDDIGVEMVETKQWGNVREPFIDLFDARYRTGKTTIITTNLRPSEIGERYGTRIIDRFRECMNDIVLDGKSLRK